MKRSGFTMIELIFVIVILGILAAVAIPKLAATRDDAEISKIASNAATLLSDLSAFYTSQGESKWKDGNTTWGMATNVEVFSDTTLATDAKDDTLSTTTVYIGSGDEHCLSFIPGTSGTLEVKENNSTSTTVCTKVVKEVKNLIKTHKFGGTGVVR